MTTSKKPRFIIREDGKIQGIPYGEKPLAKPFHIRFPQDIDAKLRELEDRQQFVRDAVIEKMERENL